MLYRLAADALLVAHLLFILFVLLGGLLLLRWRVLALVHLPAMAWGAATEFFSLPCPLTGWENALRRAAGESGYDGGFIEHYLLALIYPAGLTPGIQVWLGTLVLLVNALVYLWLLGRRR
ncbi:DUF2784 domain-containing protein [Azotobacter beijerinckii]|uniref:DUF2784 domain-containing protein n=1 Tax=Azotobacter beijerinckii TaxID=170623 RepID=A0A1I4D0S2_9GAMM|nr:DUF2784 domain-containing protein [Azotobacter beijerinckii]SFB28211.1 Protein of Unknown function [Azotobacter beijerinckii]SFK87092.1 Protein of Unknown function [Azotobacter beijerinckii]